MEIPSKQSIIKLLNAGDKKKHSHVIICLNRFDYKCSPIYVEKNEDIDEVIARLLSSSSHSMMSILEIYNYALNLNSQLEEDCAMHIEPKPPHITLSQAEKALEFATLKHHGQHRLDGSDYITHPLRVAEYVKRYKKSEAIDILEASSYLHDTIEDTDARLEDLISLFGPSIAGIVRELTTDEDEKKAIGKARYLSLKMKNMSSWALTIKLCDRLDNISDLDECEESFRARYTDETISIIAFLVRARILSETQLRITKDIIAKLHTQSHLKPEEQVRLEKIAFPEKRIALVNSNVK